MLCSLSTSGALRLTLRTNGLPFMRSEVEAGMSDHVRPDESETAGLQSNVKRARKRRLRCRAAFSPASTNGLSLHQAVLGPDLLLPRGERSHAICQNRLAWVSETARPNILKTGPWRSTAPAWAIRAFVHPVRQTVTPPRASSAASARPSGRQYNSATTPATTAVPIGPPSPFL